MKTTRPVLLSLFIGVCVRALGASAGYPLESPVSMEAARDRMAVLARSLSDKPVQPALLHEWANGRLYLRNARFLLETYEPSEALLAAVSNDIQAAESALASLERGVPPPWVEGFRLEGYYSDNDGSFQPFLRYLPKGAKTGGKRPLLVYLHGYNPFYNLVNWAHIPDSVLAFSEREGFAVAAPFGRSNTDYQGIGEQDVLRVIEEMKHRYAIDEDRVILSGHSMGASGVWTIGAHYPDRFAGLFAVSGRGDYYVWHGVSRGELPAYKQRLIDAEFAGSLVQNLRHIPIFCAHGAWDDLVPVREARHIAEAVKKVNPDLIYNEYEFEGHGAWDMAFESPEAQEWLRQCRRAEAPADYRAAHPRYASATNALLSPLGPVNDAFLSPFLFVLAGDPPSPETVKRFKGAVFDWYRYAKARPRTAVERAVDPDSLRSFNVFLFGEPETSELIRAALADSPVHVTSNRFVVGARAYPRQGNGLYVVRPSPWNSEKRAVVQCGLPWGEGLPENHKYDFLPDYIVYSSDRDEDGSNTALAAGFFNALGQLEN